MAVVGGIGRLLASQEVLAPHVVVVGLLWGEVQASSIAAIAAPKHPVFNHEQAAQRDAIVVARPVLCHPLLL